MDKHRERSSVLLHFGASQQRNLLELNTRNGTFIFELADRPAAARHESFRRI